MVLEKTKKITINIPVKTFLELAKVRKLQGISVSFQMTEGALLYLESMK